MGYRNDTILTKEGYLLSLKSIESIKQGDNDDEQQVVDALKGDVILIARTIGGFEYVISMLHIKEKMPEWFAGEDPNQMASNTVNRWKHIVFVKTS